MIYGKEAFLPAFRS